MSLVNTPPGTFTTTGTVILPGIGTVIGSVVDALNTLLGGASQKDVANNQFIDNLVYSAQQLGFSGFTHDDVVHLMPGGWGSNYQMATSQFQAYLNMANQHPIGTNLAPYFSFGGGYYPTHEITFYPSNSTTGSGQVIPGSGNVGSIGTGVNNPIQTTPSTASFGSLPMILLGGVVLVVVFSLIGQKG